MPSSLIGIVIPTHGRSSTLAGTLQALIDQEEGSRPFEVTVVEDGTTPGRRDKVLSTITPAFALRWITREWGGPAAARNTGWRREPGDIIAFLDDDVLPRKDWLISLRRAVAAHPEAGGWEGRTAAVDLHRPMTHSVENLAGGRYLSCNIAYTRRALEEQDGFDEKFTAPINEDQDLGLRVAEKHPVIFCPDMLVVHPPKPWRFFPTLASRPRFARAYFYSEIYFYLKHPEDYARLRAFPNFRKTLRRQVLFYTAIQLRPQLGHAFRRPLAFLESLMISAWMHICLGWTAFQYLF